MEEAGVCVPEEGEPGLGGILVSLPLPQGTAGTLGQSFHGFTSHSGNGAYAVDFPMAEGALIVAARDGRVREVREDSDSGCGDASCTDA